MFPRVNVNNNGASTLGASRRAFRVSQRDVHGPSQFLQEQVHRILDEDCLPPERLEKQFFSNETVSIYVTVSKTK